MFETFVFQAKCFSEFEFIRQKKLNSETFEPFFDRFYFLKTDFVLFLKKMYFTAVKNAEINFFFICL